MKLDDIDNIITRTTAPNMVFVSGGFTCKIAALCFYLSLKYVDCFELRNLP